MKNDVTNQLRLLRWLNDQGFKFMICLGPKQLENQDFNPFYATSFFYTSWKHQQSRGFVMISLGIEKSSAMKCVSMGFLVTLFWLLCKIFSWTAYNSWTARKLCLSIWNVIKYIMEAASSKYFISAHVQLPDMEKNLCILLQPNLSIIHLLDSLFTCYYT